MSRFYRSYLLWSLILVTSFAKAGTIPYSLTEIATCIGSFSSGCTVQNTSSGTPITSSKTVSSSGESVTYNASSVSLPASLGGAASLTSDTFNSSGPGIMVDALEQWVDSVTISDPGFDGQTGFLFLRYTLDGTNSATGADAGATYGSTGVPYACVKAGINDPILPFGCTGYDQPALDKTVSSALFSFTFGEAFPLWFQLESIAGTGFGPGRPTGLGTSDASFYSTATIDGFAVYDQNMNQLGGAPTITSAAGVSYQNLDTPEPSYRIVFIFGVVLLAGAKMYQHNRQAAQTHRARIFS